MAPDPLSIGRKPENFSTHATPVVSSTNMNDDTIDLYSIERSETTKSSTVDEVPFIYNIHIIGLNRRRLKVKALFDGGAMVSAMSTTAFKGVQNQLGDMRQSKRRLRMADGAVLPSQWKWEGCIELGSVEVYGEFEVFDSKGGWDFLFGKPLLRQFKAIHDYEADIVTIKHPHTGLKLVLHNQARLTSTNTRDEKGICLTLDVKQWENITGGTSGENPPLRQVPNNIDKTIQPMCDENNENIDQYRTSDDKAEMTIDLAEQNIDGEVNMHSNKLGGNEKPPSR